MITYNYRVPALKCQPTKLPQKLPSVKFKLMANNLPQEQNYLSWHYSTALPEFIKNRQRQLTFTLSFFNIGGFLRTLFVPYRRLEITGKAPSLIDKISFNLISRTIGVTVRILLIIAGIGSTILFAVFQLMLIFVYLIPIFSLAKYQRLKKNSLVSSDLEDVGKFTAKLTATDLFQLLSTFFPGDFGPVFTNLPAPSTLDIKTTDKLVDVFTKLAKNFQKLAIYIEQKSIKPQEFELLVKTLNHHLESQPPPRPAPIGQLLAFGYTNTLDRFATELTGQTSSHIPAEKFELLGEIAKVLARPQNNNVLLVGEPGVGRHTTLHFLASAIGHLQLLELAGKRLMLLDSVALAGTGKNLLEVKGNFEAVMTEAKHAGNIILGIDQIDRLSSSADGRIDLSEVLTTMLTDNSLPIIGITTLDDFSQFIRPNSNFLKLFEKIDIEEASRQETIAILTDKALEISKGEKIATSFGAILEIAQRSDQLLPDRRQPEKSLILFDDLVSEAKARNLLTIEVNLVDEVISTKTKTPIGKISESEAQKLKNLEEILHKRIVNQNEAIEEIARAMRRARAEIETGARPIGSFLFLGPTGVGKTETAKALAQIYFGSEEKMVRLDMSEYQGTDSLSRLIGDIRNKTQGQLASLIRQHPFALLLVDEFEKADSSVHNLFLQVLDEGHLTDAFGKKVSFDNIIIIATSNAAAEFIREEVTKGTADLSKKLIDYILEKGLFSPELINRFDAVVVYQPLTDEQTGQVTKLMLNNLAQKIKETKNITLEITDELCQKVAKAGYDPTFGARPIRRLIADKIEDGIAKMIIEESAKNGDKIAPSTLLKFVT